MTKPETMVEELQAEITRLRSLLIDPGDPAWEDARAVLATELRKADRPHAADDVLAGRAASIPSWIALNLIAHASRPTPSEAPSPVAGEVVEALESALRISLWNEMRGRGVSQDAALLEIKQRIAAIHALALTAASLRAHAQGSKT